MREISHKEYVHERLGGRFEEQVSHYDTRRRVEVLIDEFLTEDMIAGKSAIEVGAGLGYFSERLVQRGARLVATDIGAGLLDRVRERAGCECEVVDALSLEEHFSRDRFDLVLSSECIEHTPDPYEALRQMAAVLKPGGYLSVSTPNWLWLPIVRLATLLKLRPYDGLENFSSFGGIRRTLDEAGVDVLREKGLHLFPFQIPLHRLLTWCDENLQPVRCVMINICILGRKRSP